MSFCTYSSREVPHLNMGAKLAILTEAFRRFLIPPDKYAYRPLPFPSNFRSNSSFTCRPTILRCHQRY